MAQCSIAGPSRSPHLAGRKAQTRLSREMTARWATANPVPASQNWGWQSGSQGERVMSPIAPCADACKIIRKIWVKIICDFSTEFARESIVIRTVRPKILRLKPEADFRDDKVTSSCKMRVEDLKSVRRRFDLRKPVGLMFVALAKFGCHDYRRWTCAAIEAKNSMSHKSLTSVYAIWLKIRAATETNSTQ